MILPLNNIYQGECLEILSLIPDETINCCVTSPPYFGLRDYGTTTWEGGDIECEHGVDVWEGVKQTQGAQSGHSSKANRLNRDFCEKCGATRVDEQLGLEATPEEYVEKMVVIFREIRRVLRSDGTLWLNLGDSYAGYHGNKNKKYSDAPSNKNGYFENQRKSTVGVSNLKQKDLMGIPWRVAFALQADGWYLRSEIIWHKPNPMPESVTDRPTKSHEQIFLLSKSQKYYYDHEAIKEPLADSSIGRAERKQKLMDRTGQGTLGKQIENGVESTHSYAGLALGRNGKTGYDLESGTRNKRSVWSVATKSFRFPKQTSHWVRVEQGVFYDGMRSIVSPDCPIHGRQGDLNDGHAIGNQTHMKHICNCPFQEHFSEPVENYKSLSTQKTESNLSSSDRRCSSVANDHSTGSHKTDPSPETSQPCTSCAQIPDHIENRLISLGWTSPCLYNLANSILSGGFSDNLLRQILDDRTGKLKPLVSTASEVPPINCLCSHYHNKTKNTSHFATFPPALITPCVLAGCPKDGIVYDPFMGAGTTAMVARDNSRNYLGSEINQEYIDLANERLSV